MQNGRNNTCSHKIAQGRFTLAMHPITLLDVILSNAKNNIIVNHVQPLSSGEGFAIGVCNNKCTLLSRNL